jgi:hypothetical protein
MQGESGGGLFFGADLIGDISDHNPMMPMMGSYTGLLYDQIRTSQELVLQVGVFLKEMEHAKKQYWWACVCLVDIPDKLVCMYRTTQCVIQQRL